MSNTDVLLNIDQEYITLQSLLHFKRVISSGGIAKIFLQENDVLVNGEIEKRRGRKLYPGDEVEVANQTFIIKKV